MVQRKGFAAVVDSELIVMGAVAAAVNVGNSD